MTFNFIFRQGLPGKCLYKSNKTQSSAAMFDIFWYLPYFQPGRSNSAHNYRIGEMHLQSSADICSQVWMLNDLSFSDFLFSVFF